LGKMNTFSLDLNKVGPLTYIQIRQNNGHLPMKFRLTAYPPSDNYRHIGHNNCLFRYLTYTS